MYILLQAKKHLLIMVDITEECSAKGIDIIREDKMGCFVIGDIFIVCGVVAKFKEVCYYKVAE